MPNDKIDANFSIFLARCSLFVVVHNLTVYKVEKSKKIYRNWQWSGVINCIWRSTAFEIFTTLFLSFSRISIVPICLFSDSETRVTELIHLFAFTSSWALSKCKSSSMHDEYSFYYTQSSITSNHRSKLRFTCSVDFTTMVHSCTVGKYFNKQI